jgi:hypothetical protein
LVICDTEDLANSDIKNTRYVTKHNVSMTEFDMLVRHCMFLVVPIKEDITAPAGITVIVKGFLAGKACISTTGAGVDEYIQHGVNGLIVNNNELALEKSIRYVMDPKKRKRMENNINKHRFTSDGIRDSIMEMMISIFENI